jgi:hypothetical protein
MMQFLPTRTLAKSPRMMASDSTMFFPFKTMFWEPQRTDNRLTRFPDAWETTTTLSKYIKLLLLLLKNYL